MGSLILLIVAAIWVAVLVPPLLRSRLENRPNSSVSDFRDQLSSLQKAVPSTRTGSMRAMGRPLAPSSLARPAAPGRPLRSGVSMASGGSTRSPRQQAAMRPAADTYRQADPSARRTRADVATRTHGGAIAAAGEQESMKRRRSNVLFVLAVISVCSVFLAVTTSSAGVAWVAGLSCLALLGYIFLLAQQANVARPRTSPARRQPTARHQSAQVDGPRQHRAAAPAPRRRAAPAPVDVAWDDDDDEFEPTPRQYRGARAQPAPAPAPRRTEAARPRGWSEDPRPSGIVYGDPLFMSREQPVVRRERPNTRRRQPEWSPAV